MAEGRAWALDPSSEALTCLFEVSDPGPFTWGPLGDRVLLGGLHMEAIGGQTLQAPLDVQAGPSAWGHPMGTAVAFVSGDGMELDKRYLDQKGIVDISPLHGVSYLSVTYHPSGLALAFVVEREGRQSIWLSSNLGEDPRRLVFSKEGTEFGALEFPTDGRSLVYAAQHADGHPECSLSTWRTAASSAGCGGVSRASTSCRCSSHPAGRDDSWDSPWERRATTTRPWSVGPTAS